MPRNLYVDCYPNLFNTPRGFSAPVFLEFPVAVVEWTHLARFEPPRDAVEMECMIADTPCYRALLGCRRCLVSLAFYAKVHNVVAADGAVVYHDV